MDGKLINYLKSSRGSVKNYDDLVYNMQEWIKQDKQRVKEAIEKHIAFTEFGSIDVQGMRIVDVKNLLKELKLE